MISLAHPVGNSFVRAALAAFDSAGLLDSFYTTLAFSPRELARWPAAITRQLARRSYDIAPRKIHRAPLRETLRLVSQRFGVHALTRHETGVASLDAVCRALDQRVARAIAKNHVDTVYAYEDSALETFRVARARGIRCVYDLPIGHFRAARTLLEEEARRLPEWANTLPGNFDSAAKLARKDEELQLADVVIVPSTFTKDTLATAPFAIKKIATVLFGAPAVVPRVARARGDKLRVLYVGSLTQRKGIAYLLEAIAPLREAIALTIIGQRVAPCRPLDAALTQHRYLPSLPQREIFAAMSEHDVLVLPSLFEGLALVQLEAMARGMVVIGTDNSGARDIIDDGKNGFIVPIRDARAITERLEQLRAAPTQLQAMSRAAQTQAQRFTWQRYGDELVAIVRSLDLRA